MASIYGSAYESRKLCDYLEMVCGLDSLHPRSKQQIVDAFLQVRSLPELRRLCYYIQDRLRTISANPDYFTVDQMIGK